MLDRVQQYVRVLAAPIWILHLFEFHTIFRERGGWNGMEFCCLDSRLLCLADRHSMAGQRTSRVRWGTKVLGQNPSIRHPHHARQICKTSRKPRFSIVLQTTLHMLGKFARLPNSRSFRLSYKLPCRFVLIWKHLKSVTKVLNKIRENI